MLTLNEPAHFRAKITWVCHWKDGVKTVSNRCCAILGHAALSSLALLALLVKAQGGSAYSSVGQEGLPLAATQKSSSSIWACASKLTLEGQRG
jgi:hypothetical protein